ncbi:alpha-glucuronidase [Coriobacterium glomerans PW2]|uniref:Alpha-glucuronidase n=1 Tax=Coriobacterium glomerans (strain ATCC 49209 / DSM 20642 / JCM 10262 / PW2) TaxID=700015 RepID=F2NBD7_CORGP|nr:alpha-glucuronidase [Coriobacterium glomerans]AEB06673.1 alpha-glucuronidase [Coriobacterium glomerans PW2]
MEFDQTWLTSEVVERSIGGKSFYFDDLPEENEVSLRLRSEILGWGRARITSDKEDAEIILRVRPGVLATDESYRLESSEGVISVIGNTSRGILYGFYSMVRRMINHQGLNFESTPSQPIRMIDHWDQIDGTIERGYAGESLFFGQYGKNSNPDRKEFSVRDVVGDPFRRDYQRVEFYARMLSSIGINAVSLNNVNVRGLATFLITDPLLDGVADIAQIFTSFGIKTYLAINWEAPKRIKQIKTSDPLDQEVRDFWKEIARNIYNRIPDFGGFVVKADSEGEPGPYQYKRTHADGANMLAEAVEPYGGHIFWRTFVYNSRQDWRDRSTDRAKASSENFLPLDGQFKENVSLQIKFGPIDFQTSEPLTPLFGGLKRTNQVMEFQITAEYLGHQIDINYIVPQWKKVISFDTKYRDVGDSVASCILKEHAIDPEKTGFTSVGNVGMDYNWTGNKLSQANLYGYGRLSWDNELTPEEILDEWINQTFLSIQPKYRKTIYEIMITSNETYKKYNAPLGIGFMVVPSSHYGVSVNGYEYDRWGTYHFADRNGVGVDRSVATGTGFSGLYSDEVARMYEDPATTPDDVLLFFHHVPYTHVLQSGETVIQHIYNTHFDGYEGVLDYIKKWSTLEGVIDEIDYSNVARRLQLQKQNALEWRDQINTYFYRMSGIADEHNRTIYE